jgi:hypothetical protein
MKKLLTLSLLALCTKCAIAQDYDREFKPFKINVSPGYAIPQGPGIKGGLLFSIEPKYAFTGDRFSFGLRLETAMIGPATGNVNSVASTTADTNGGSNALQGDINGSTNTAQKQANASCLLTGDYYFNNNNLRPFLGTGLGLYTITNTTGKNDGDILPNATFSNKFGFMLRGGFEWGHLRTGFEYNFVSNTSEVRSGYIGIKLGIILGGGRFGLISDN